MEIKLFFHSNPWIWSKIWLLVSSVSKLSVSRAFLKLAAQRGKHHQEMKRNLTEVQGIAIRKACAERRPSSTRNTGLTELFKSSLSNSVSESFLTPSSTWALSLGRGSKGGLQIGLSVQPSGCHPSQRQECQWGWRFVWCGVPSLLLQIALCFPYSLVFLETPRAF